MKAGLEIHQQLDTKEKLFCSCPTKLRKVEESNLEFYRYLRPSPSELGEIDVAAKEEELRRRKIIYKAFDSTCLVENDEEPPHELNQEALDVTLQIAKLLNMNPVDEVHTMRKVVIDGSNTCGFQRTALAATDGHVETKSGRVSIEGICLEEDAARKVSESDHEVIYSLDRLGVPLVEISTAPEIKTSSQAREVAEYIGMILRSTKRVKRGVGTIRQDINLSVEGGARVEIKGVQKLQHIPKVIENEVTRQKNLLDISRQLKARGAWVDEKIIDISEIFSNTKSETIKKALQNNGIVLAVALRNFSGLLKKEISPNWKFASEIADRAVKRGVSGIFNTDEMHDDKTELRKATKSDKYDCVLFVADEKERAKSALIAIKERAKEAIKGVPGETRRALLDGTTEYLRPLPGAARMYPETDVPPVEINEERFEKIELVETPDERKERYMKDFGLSEELSSRIACADYELFERIMDRFELPATLVTRILTSTIPSLERESIPTENITEQHLWKLFECLSKKEFAKEAIPDLLRLIAKDPMKDVRELIYEIGYAISISDLEKIIDDIIRERRDFIAEKGERAFSPLMGVVMGEVRGRIDGKIVSQILRRKLDEII